MNISIYENIKDENIKDENIKDENIKDENIINKIIKDFDNINLIKWNEIDYTNNYLLNKCSIYSTIYILPTISFKTIHTSILYDMVSNVFTKYLSYMYNIEHDYSCKIIKVFSKFYFNLDKVIYDIENICGTINNKQILLYKSIEYYLQRIFIIYNIRGPICNLEKFNIISQLEIYISYIINNKSTILYNELQLILNLKHNKTTYLNELILQLSEHNKDSLKNICKDIIKIYNSSDISTEYYNKIRLYKLYFTCFEKKMFYEYDEYRILFCVYLILLFNDINYHILLKRKTLFTLIIGNNSIKNKMNLDKLLLRIFTYIHKIQNTIVKTNLILILLYLCDINKEYLLEKRHKYIKLKYLYDYSKYNIEDIRNNLKKFLL